jgi:hypothetical protein
MNKEEFNIDNYVDTNWIAARTGYTLANITRKIRNKEIVPAFKRGRKYYFTQDVLDDLICETKFQ